jgi:nitrogenase subunit NifH
MGEEGVDAADGVYDVITICGCFSVPVKTKAFQVYVIIFLCEIKQLVARRLWATLQPHRLDKKSQR